MNQQKTWIYLIKLTLYMGYNQDLERVPYCKNMAYNRLIQRKILFNKIQIS